MRNPGGYAQVLGCDEPAVAFDSDGRRLPSEVDTLTCSHCQRVVFVRPRERPEDVGGFCRSCAGLICGPCVGKGCTPIEKRIEAWERRQDALRSYGVL